MSKKLLLLPGTKWQLALARKIKELGYTLYVVDPSDNAPCREYADIFLNVDIFDEESIDKFISEHPIDGVVSDECDIATTVLARIGEKFGLSNIGHELARLYSDKYAMRQFCKNNDLLYPEYRLCHTETEVKEFYRELGKDIIIKPLDSNASKGVFTIKKELDIDRCFKEAVKFSRIDNGIIAERYIEGTEFTIDGVVTPAGHYTLAISEKKHFSHNKNIANELYFTHSNEKYDYDLLKKINDKYVIKSGLPFGLTHAEYKFENGNFYLLEIAARGGGNKISSVISQYMSGCDTYDYLIGCALGNIKKMEFNIKEECKNRAMILKFFDTPHHGGKVKNIEGIEFLKSNSHIYDYFFSFKIGDVINDCISDSARVGYFIAGADTREELNDVISEVSKTVEIII